VNGVLESQNFRNDFAPFQRRISHFGMLNSIAQTLIKLTVPGVPDTYQGNEMWEFNLVDPDNRRAVNYEVRRHALQQLCELPDKASDQVKAFIRELADNMDDGRVKLYVIWKALNLRKQLPELFQHGEYIPLEAAGERAKHWFAFARRHEGKTLVVAVPRLSAQLLQGEPRMPVGQDIWQDTRIDLPAGCGASFRNLLPGESVAAEHGSFFAKHLFQNFPFALLVSEESASLR
jgi:(1->4)-alpha-D-glucan 1-alpha-D-glucosylmutase